MRSSSIRNLARRYAAGELSLEEYRAQRRDMMDAVTAGERRLEFGEPSLRHRRHPRLRTLIATPLVLLLIAGGVTLIWTRHSYSSHTHGSPTRVRMDMGPALVQLFIRTNDWSNASLNRFRQRWDQLPASERKAARDSYLFPRLTSQLQEQIISQQAMVNLAPDRTSAAMHLAQLDQVAASLRMKPQR